ncbi:hypothetical protein B0H14DRAFT_2613430 [Mycena olivaceomarginata]|nr:hypothetical protein B0H14DRAFT_2613430 [Mycena olivaceomarginata]
MELFSLDFDSDGSWETDLQSGPAIHAPAHIKNILIDSYRVEWLNLSEPDEDFYSKNHMVATLSFDAPVTIGDTGYSSARLSMELGERGKAVNLEATADRQPKEQYCPGEWTLRLLTYSTPTIRSAHFRTFPVRQGLKIGDLLDKVIGAKMHHFFFLPFTDEYRWKGCGDHLIHTWAAFVRAGYITSPTSEEDPGKVLADELMYTYLPSGKSALVLVGRGWWVSHDPVQDEHTPEMMFSDARPTYKIPAKANNDN